MYFINFYQILKYLVKIVSYYCNFFLSSNFFNFELFYQTGYNNKKLLNKKYNDLIIFFYGFNKFQNTLFNTFINNYYASDFYVKNSKIMFEHHVCVCSRVQAAIAFAKDLHRNP